MKESSDHMSPEVGAHSAGAGIGVSITSERGQRFRYKAETVSLRMTAGVIQIVERARGCFVWFDGCKLEIREQRRKVLFRLRSGSASNNGTDLTVVAEIAHSPGSGADNETADASPTRESPAAARQKKAKARKVPQPKER